MRRGGEIRQGGDPEPAQPTDQTVCNTFDEGTPGRAIVPGVPAFHLGAWQDVLPDVICDALIVDPPYGPRTHRGHNAGVDHTMVGSNGATALRSETSRRRQIRYDHWEPDDVRAFVEHWSPRTRGWFCAMSCSDLAPVWRQAFEDVGRVSFAPVSCVIRAMSVRLAGDGPSNWTIYLNVARPRGQRWAKWGSLNGAYIVNRSPGHIGGKPLKLMREIVRDYSRHGDLVCDPCAGGGTTLTAASWEGRRAVGAEVDPSTYEAAARQLRGLDPDGDTSQQELF